MKIPVWCRWLYIAFDLFSQCSCSYLVMFMVIPLTFLLSCCCSVYIYSVLSCILCLLCYIILFIDYSVFLYSVLSCVLYIYIFSLWHFCLLCYLYYSWNGWWRSRRTHVWRCTHIYICTGVYIERDLFCVLCCRLTCACLLVDCSVPSTIWYLARYGTWHDLADLVPGTIRSGTWHDQIIT